MSYLVRMTKPNSIYSHDWHIQPNCQRSWQSFHLSGDCLDRGLNFDAQVSSNLLRLLYTDQLFYRFRKSAALLSFFARTF